MNILESNKKYREFTGVEKFHKVGYFGERAAAVTGETIDPAWFPGNYAENLGGESADWGHAYMTAATFFQAAPLAKLYSCPQGMSYIGGKFSSKMYDEWIPKLKELGVTVMFNSTDSHPNSSFVQAISERLKELPWFTPFYAAGNESNDSFSKWLKVPEITGVGAIVIDVNGNVYPANYTSKTDLVDFGSTTNINYTGPNDNYEASCSGTSAATPWLCGMACLVQDFFVHRTGKPLDRESLLRFFMDHTVDVGAPGFDTQVGNGAVVLPDPKDIDIFKYQKWEDCMEYTDKDKIPAWAREGVAYCTANGLMDGVDGGRFDPEGVVTRAQLATVLARLANK